MNLNKVLLMGNLTRDPELKTLPSGSSVASFGIATNRVWKNQQGERQEEVQFHNIVVFGKQAETASQYLKKGASAFIEGRLQTRNWDAQDGTKKSKTEIVAKGSFRTKKTRRRNCWARRTDSNIWQGERQTRRAIGNNRISGRRYKTGGNTILKL